MGGGAHAGVALIPGVSPPAGPNTSVWMREASNPRAARPALMSSMKGCGPAHVHLGIGGRLEFGEHWHGDTSHAVEVSAFEVIWVGAAVVHLGPCVRQRPEEGTGLGGERVLATGTAPRPGTKSFDPTVPAPVLAAWRERGWHQFRR